MKFTRVAPGLYANEEGVTIVRFFYGDSTPAWTVVEAGGYGWDPVPTLAEAKAQYAAMLAR